MKLYGYYALAFLSLFFLPSYARNTADLAKKSSVQKRTLRARKPQESARLVAQAPAMPKVSIAVGGKPQDYVPVMKNLGEEKNDMTQASLPRQSNQGHDHPLIAPFPKVIEPEYSQLKELRKEPIKKQSEETIKQELTSKQQLEVSSELLYPKAAIERADDLVEVNLDKADLPNVLQWIEKIYGITFLSGDAIDPADQNALKVAGKYITYKSNVALTKRGLWDLFLRFLYILGITPIAKNFEDKHPTSYTLVSNLASNRESLPAFVGINWQELPSNDTKIRYVYFVENSQVDALFKIADELRSPKAVIYSYPPLNALIICDIASNVRAIMQIIAELDSVSMPEALSVLRLRHANASDVEKLYAELVSAETKQSGPGNVATRLFQRKETTSIYFPENTRIIAEPRTNSLIILGNREGIEKVENFIINHVDTELKQPYSPLYVYELQYANASNIADILNNVTNFGRDGSETRDAATYGGVRDGDKFFKPMTFIPESTGNRLLIKGEKEDYLKVRDIIRKLDVKQPQVAIEVLIVNVSATKVKELGAQLRNKRTDTLGKHVEFQTSGVLNPTVSNQGIIVNRDGGLMGNLVQLASGQNIGSTLISIGSDLVGGVWALFKALETYTYTNIVSHPFLTTTNKYTARVSLGETRRVQTATVQGSGQATQTQDDVAANLTVIITPQINTDGIVLLNIEINIDNFSQSNVPTSAQRETRVIKTIANVANGEILAIGGLLKTRSENQTSKVPLLGNIPVLGWFFKDHEDANARDNLLVFISPKIVEPQYGGGMSTYSKNKADFAKNMVCQTAGQSEHRDPIHRWFFNQPEEKSNHFIDDYLDHASECDRLPENWWGAKPGCPPNFIDNPLTAQASEQKPLVTKKRSSMLDLLPQESCQEACA